MRSRLLLLLPLLVASGCENQEAVPLSRSIPVAVLQLVALAAVVGGGWALLQRQARRAAPRPAHPTGATVSPHAAVARAARTAGAVVAGGLGLVIVGYAATVVVYTPFHYQEPTYQLFSWEDSVVWGWVLVVAGGSLALGELRLARALVRDSRLAPWVAGAQTALIGVPTVLGVVGGA